MKQTNDNLTIINDLQKEIQCLKNILDREGISYQKELDQLKNSTNTEPFETNQGSRIVFPNEITKDMANRFFARFWGRTDVYAKRVENKKTKQSMGGDIADYLDEEIVPYEELDESEKAACQMAAFLISGMILVIAGIVIPLF